MPQVSGLYGRDHRREIAHLGGVTRDDAYVREHSWTNRVSASIHEEDLTVGVPEPSA